LDIAVEVAEAVTAALFGEFVPTLVNASAIRSETLMKIKPRVLLAERLGRLAYSLAGGTFSGFVTIHFCSDGDDGESRLIKTGVIKGLMAPRSDHVINVVNADVVSKAHGLHITEIKTSPVVDENEDRIVLEMTDIFSVEGRVIGNKPHVTRIGEFEVDVVLEGLILAYYQVDKPGQIGKIGSILGEANVNISFMTLGRHVPSQMALVLLGLDNQPDEKTLEKIRVNLELEKKPVLLDLGEIFE
jgi:D-3-phosphoglycerate dehydrogenase